ncbi:uncharacterized protein [Nicotiana tomentosiformis]|uniref:uncharacterized protein n=1 Tax=Nicotiana tomentosiformis TaxID=4098 RepID=UPI00388CA238
MAPFEALYGRQCRLPIGWFELDEDKLYGTDLVKDALKKVKLIQERLRTAQSRQKNYAYQKALDLSFMVGVHPIFHVSMLRKYHVDLSRVLDFSTVQLDESIGYEDEPVAIVDRQICQLRSKKIFEVKVQWWGQPVED